MKKLICSIFIALLFPIVSMAEDYSFVKTGGGDKNVIGTLANETGLAYNRNYYLVPSQYGMGKVSTVISYAPKTYANVTFSTMSIAMGSGNISITAHGLTLGLPVIVRETAGTIPGPLVAETTYYVIPISANVIQLATTSAQALLYDEILFVSSTTSGTQTYTVIAQADAGNITFAYSGSNDGTNFYAITSSAVISGSVAARWGYDFSEYNYAVLKLAVTAPTMGSIAFSDYVNMKP